MADIIQLLPDSVANQIAAGEVVQRPASVIKELVENAIDAGATDVSVVVKDAGKTLIQVIDNGCGMTETDARLCFERHATSKIRSADDLFNLHTKGFRGEALASIAAIAHVELRTRRAESQVGSRLLIEGSRVLSQEAVSCPVGSNFMVKNLFYNTPARRKFLKADAAEMKHIVSELQRVALVHNDVAFRLLHNDNELLNLPASLLRQRLVGLFGKNMNKELVSVATQTSIVRVEGFIGKPSAALRRSGDQYLFVNDRFFKSSYFHKAVMNAYENILPAGMHPTYFIYLFVEPQQIDVNIHPTKTEIKFADSVAIFQILELVVKEALGKFNIAPAMDFGEQGLYEMPLERPEGWDSGELRPPEPPVDYSYNPFVSTAPSRPQNKGGAASASSTSTRGTDKESWDSWENMLEAFEKEHQIVPDDELAPAEAEASQTSWTATAPSVAETAVETNLIQFKRKYIVTPVKSGLMLIDQRRAHERILYELFLSQMERTQAPVQQSLYPKHLELPADDAVLLTELLPDLRQAGFDVEPFGRHAFVLRGTPADLGEVNGEALVHQLLENFKQQPTELKLKLRERLALSLAKSSAIEPGRKLNGVEMQSLVDSLFACQVPNFSPDGKTAIVILEADEVDKRFK